MTIQNFKDRAAAAITPIKANFNDAGESCFVGIVIVSDNLADSCTLRYDLMGDDGTLYYSGHLIIAGEDYANWQGDNTFCFTYTGAQLGLNFI